MSKRINVNPGQYKSAGRLRMGEPGTQQADRRALVRAHPEKKGSTPNKSRRKVAPQPRSK